MRLVRQGDRIFNLGLIVLAEWDEGRKSLTIHFATYPAGATADQTQTAGPVHFVRSFSGSDAEAVWAKLSKDAV